MSGGAEAIVLCEDLQSWVFVRRTLVALGFEPRRIRTVPFPHGRGCGEQHVRESFADQLVAHRSRVGRRRAVLVVHVDADRLTVAARRAALMAALSARQLEPPQPGEAVAVLIPRREIETWIHFLLVGPPVDEESSYAKLGGCESEAWPAAELFARYARDGTMPVEAPPSLHSGLDEIRRIR